MSFNTGRVYYDEASPSTLFIDGNLNNVCTISLLLSSSSASKPFVRLPEADWDRETASGSNTGIVYLDWYRGMHYDQILGDSIFRLGQMGCIRINYWGIVYSAWDRETAL